jgi:hypothetical protein
MNNEFYYGSWNITSSTPTITLTNSTSIVITTYDLTFTPVLLTGYTTSNSSSYGGKDLANIFQSSSSASGPATGYTTSNSSYGGKDLASIFQYASSASGPGTGYTINNSSYGVTDLASIFQSYS